VTFDGCVVIEGGTGAGLTVSVAALLVMLPTAFDTMTSNCAPLSATAVGFNT
jgi:hypothetical protein